MTCERLHGIFNDLERHRFPYDGSAIPKNGIYVLFEKGEHAHGNYDRIVRIGTHTGHGNLPKRLAEHFLVENKDRSIFRKNIGRAILNKRRDPFLELWELDLTTGFARQQHAGQINPEKLSKVEAEVSEVIRSKFTFAVFQMDDELQRLAFEKCIIAAINHCRDCQPSSAWLGNHSPKHQIRESGLWLVQGLNACDMTAGEMETLGNMIGQVEQRDGHI
jgi:hypothetical protein